MADTNQNGRALFLVGWSYVGPVAFILGAGFLLYLFASHVSGPWHTEAGARHAANEVILHNHSERLAVIEDSGVADRFRGKDAKALWGLLRERDPTLPEWAEADPR